MTKIFISPSILSADFANLEQEIKKVETNGADWIHIDVMDGHFVPNITIGIPVVKSIKNITDLPLDVHLMIDNPEKYIEEFSNAGANIITFHYEAIKNNYPNNYKEKTIELINKIKEMNVKAGLSIKPKTSPNEILEFLHILDMVLIMTVEPGFGGQKFMEDCAEKIKTIKESAPKNLIIQVDGGINDKTAKICTELGATSLVAGSFIYKSENIRKAIESLRI